jgi:hypothetical protein
MQSEKIEKIVDLAATLASKADDIDQVLVIYRLKEGVKDEEDATHGSLDNDLELRDSLWLVKAFEFWLQASALGLLKAKDEEKQ